ncbi:hypothetical protein TRICI_003313 [Trichomonascus ciferrii]|uniref:Small ribosomal subunit protein uS4m n=1 Tax=Trichomonascus ciferrii TaxID=44093 RepID=A0A642V5D5_9ASCO|nr:hypothetical protein TRICI_003313 [Trichomonascus ciferrii]
MFQQQWSAKQETRAYHGEKLTETQFRNIFKGELNAVNPLKSTKVIEEEGVTQEETPWALQTYLAIERRLDTAVFRSFFASSPRQAAQFIVKGQVRVNGIKIKQPGYELKPGDVFSVDPEHVLFALGRKKPSVKESVTLVNRQIKKYNNYLARCRKYPETMWRLRQNHRRKHVIFNKHYTKRQAKRNAAWNQMVNKEMNKEIDDVTPVRVLEGILRNEPYFDKHGTLPYPQGVHLNKSLSVFSLVTGKRTNANANANEEKEVEKEKQKQDEANKESQEDASSLETADEARVKELVGRYYGKNESSPSNKSDVKQLVQDIIKAQQEDIRKQHTSRLRGENDVNEKYDPSWVNRLPEKIEPIDPAQAEEDPASVKVQLPFSNGKLYGLSDPKKGYFTPWNPRPFLAPFAVLPHHIEISFKTCHAVYLRDPVARPGHSEIITPFPLDMHERAYMFYIRKRRKYL